MLSYSCPTCGTLYRADEKHAGADVRCPKCGQVVRIPSPATTPADWLGFERFCGIMAIACGALAFFGMATASGSLSGTIGPGLALIAALSFVALWLLVGDVSRRVHPDHVAGILLLIGIFGFLGWAVWLAFRPPFRSTAD